MKNFDYITVAKKVLEIESKALIKQIDQIDQAFVDACELCLECSGKLIVMGLGKSGHIADKIAATLSSTGTPSYFIHPSEAIHGDIGMIDEKDIVLIFSYSGETEEIIAQTRESILLKIPAAKEQNGNLIACMRIEWPKFETKHVIKWTLKKGELIHPPKSKEC